jgi:uncharacterized protein (DUF486 family)
MQIGANIRISVAAMTFFTLHLRCRNGATRQDGSRQAGAYRQMKSDNVLLRYYTIIGAETTAALLAPAGRRAIIAVWRVGARLSDKELSSNDTMKTVALLLVSNIFMTTAWYGHLRFKEVPLWQAILGSWLIAFVEYCFQVPANRIGSYQFSAAQLKTIQEVISLLVFSVFSVLYLKDQLRWNYVAAFVLILGAVVLVFKKW